ncbi:MAG: DUF3426 domain-containing protein [Proteobacteria bacterium]|nr:DUF3426 domain-containing protein [Pseudomonadota bacterium]
MFTQCPACQTIFKLSAETLRAAAGEVRCGRCGEEFNALGSLAEEPQAFAGAAAQQAPRTTEPAPESRAPMDFAADLKQTSHTDADSQSIADDPSLEFTLPPGELDRIFVEARPHHFAPRRGPLALRGLEELEPTDTHTAVGAAPAGDAPAWIAGTSGAAAAMPAVAGDPAAAAATNAASAMGTAGAAPARISAASALAAGATARALRMDAAPFTTASPEAHAGAPGNFAFDAALDAAFADERAASAFPEDAPPAQAATEPAGASEAAARANWIEQILPTRDIEDLAPPRERHRGRWIAAAAALALLLAVQLVHRYREPLAQMPVVGAPLRSLYELAGHPIAARLNLAAFEIRPWGVTGDTSADGTLHVRASLINNGAEPQPYPLLRLKLEDRFGTRIGARDFQPAEYLHRAPQHALSPGERADLLIDILDPGKAAEGFELDVCEPRSNARILCANDAPAGHRAP